MPLPIPCAAARVSGAGTPARLRRAVLHPAGRALRAAFAAAAARADGVCRAYAARRLLREMQEWPDERFRDIGLTRAELANAVLGTRHPFRWVPESHATRLEPARFGH